MKKIILLLSVILTTSCGVQYNYKDIAPVEKVYEVEGSKEELYVEAANWMAESFNDASSVIQFQDKEAGIITARYMLNPLIEPVIFPGQGRKDANYAIIRMQTKDGASKITVIPVDFMEQYESEAARDMRGASTPASYTEVDAINEINTLIQSYGQYLNNQDFNF